MLRERVAILSDGTTLDDLVSAGDERWVSARVMSDPELFELELERVFSRVWVMVAHESEIPAAGNFVSRYIGRDSVVVSRQDDGQIAVWLNMCSHRGGKVCATDGGTADTFRCPYHGWVYASSGSLLGVASEREVFEEPLDKTALGLQPARVGVYQGLVFACWDGEAPDLEAYLGGTRFYLDMLLGNTDSGMEVAGPPQRWVVPCNWKLAAENFSTDSYHTMSTHKSLLDLGIFPSVSAESRGAFVNVTDPQHAHSTAFRRLPDGLGDHALAVVCDMIGVPPHARDQMATNLTPDQFSLAMSHSPIAGNVFPNLGWLRIPMVTEFDGPRTPTLSIRLWHPLGHGATEIWSWCLMERDADDELKTQMRRSAIRMFGSSGIAEQDDTLMWSTIQANTTGIQGRSRRLYYHSHREPDPTWPGPGEATAGVPTEDNQWNFFRRWRELIG